jgi:hypothetical protein
MPEGYSPSAPRIPRKYLVVKVDHRRRAPAQLRLSDLP